ncbi:helix-turn-helix transcriptional regulator [Dichotomicrobium thermohalophilum]|uniref:Excisionase family DNA binding protein n=1 Tax=Dichotomicrobium thermohalophilum TaxID=933063 RepID=A0A397PH45_9HYPH|nr:helix-turn-helix transcriptional regulator [Dichotomicrobium thermohalophilum]RIA47199.1 excisionase family DNA binding protein [Dichotomicrobium thermohalophilum]
MAEQQEYLTTKEVAALLRIKERKVYDLAASGAIPCSRALGKLLFPRREVEAWLQGEGGQFSAAPRVARPNVVLGSHDPLLEWALLESRAQLASFLGGSHDGLERFARGEGIAAGLHIHEAGGWNTETASARFAEGDCVLVEWAWRQRGLILPETLAAEVRELADLKGRVFAPRAAETGSQTLFETLRAEAGLKHDDIELIAPARSEADAVLAVVDGKADAAFGLKCLARRFRLAFVPLISERFDLLVSRRAWFDPPFQTLLSFCRRPEFAEKAADLGGYDVSGFGTVHFNSA